MSKDHQDVASQPLVIVRRRRSTDESHHGGVWKIAYADFMTAMMAFFLVMWLVNAADRKTIVQVAAYFNPIRLTDRIQSPKGIEDLTEEQAKPSDENGKKGFERERHDDKKKRQANQASKQDSGRASDDAAQVSSSGSGGKSVEAAKEQALFNDPGDLLDKLADQARASQPLTAAGMPTDGNLSDPFDRTNSRAGRSEEILLPGAKVAPVAPQKQSKASVAMPAVKDKQAAQDQSHAAAANSATDQSKQQIIVPKPTPLALDQTKKEDKTHDKDEDAKKLNDEISKAVADVGRDLPHIDVKATSEGTLISLTDDAKFGMFEVGSAKPRPELVLVMEKIAQLLSGKPGELVIRGHTDSRPFKSGAYDNWRLSAARAQMAYYMLQHGGIDEARVVAIEGRADRDPKIPGDTLAAANRRIDILIKGEKK
jgi:chemotaxis protein MotB